MDLLVGYKKVWCVSKLIPVPLSLPFPFQLEYNNLFKGLYCAH